MKCCCKTCTAYVPNSPFAKEGQCRAQCPTPLFLGMMQVPGIQGRQQPIVQGFEPPVREDFWCREWRPKSDDAFAPWEEPQPVEIANA